MNNMSKSREMFEEWYRDYYSSKLKEYPEEYSLEKFGKYPFWYKQDIPQHAWQVWWNCYRETVGIINQALGVGSGES